MAYVHQIKHTPALGIKCRTSAYQCFGFDSNTQGLRIKWLRSPRPVTVSVTAFTEGLLEASGVGGKLHTWMDACCQSRRKEWMDRFRCMDYDGHGEMFQSKRIWMNLNHPQHFPANAATQLTGWFVDAFPFSRRHFQVPYYFLFFVRGLCNLIYLKYPPKFQTCWAHAGVGFPNAKRI